VNRDLDEWLDYLTSIHSSEIELGLERVKAVAEKAQLLDWSCPIVTVAGPNGKGSCVATLENLACTTGVEVGVYTSPHVLRFNERIRVNGVEVSDNDLTRAFEKIEQARDDISLTYFEFTTLAALAVFRFYEPELLVLEVGLGGRLDAVNIVDPSIAIITTISLDHEAWLGNNIEKIAKEKAGILRNGIPVIFAAPTLPEVVTLEANKLGCFVSRYGDNFWFDQVNHTYHSPRWKVSSNQPPNLHPESLSAGIYAFDYIYPRKVSEKSILEALTNGRLLGRFQMLAKKNNFLLDVAHNPQSASYLADRLGQYFDMSKPLNAVVGIMADKDIEQTLAPLINKISHWYLVPLAIPRACHPSSLKDKLLSLNDQATVTIIESISELEHDSIGNNFVVFGSFYTVEAALRALDNHG
jgi:dihydrofolate synthase/folylpolyglutamate synthase